MTSYQRILQPIFFLILTALLAASACAGADDPVPGNAPPRAVLGIQGSNTVTVGTSVTFDASQTTDPDGDSVRIRWGLVAPEGSTVSLQGAVGETQVITPDVPGAYQVTITASDDLEESTASTVLTVTEPQNRAPMAQAGDNRSADRGANVVLDGSNSTDPDGDDLSFSWSFDSRPTESTASIRNDSSATPSFTPDENGNYVIVLTVSDPDGLSDEDTVTIAVGTDNAPPTAEAGANISTEPNTTVTLSGTQSTDPDGDGLSYTWTIDSTPSGSNASLQNESSERAELTVDLEGAYVVELEVTDTGGASDADTVTVNVSSDNQAPVASFSVPSEVGVGTTIVLDGTDSTDPNGDALTYSWDVIEAPNTTNPSSDTGDIVEVSVFFMGDYTVELTVEDPGGLTDTTTRSFTGVGAMPSAAGDLILTEFLANPSAVGDDAGEWVEFYNPSSSTTYNLKDCILTDDGSDSAPILDTVNVGPGEYVTLSNGSSPGFTPDYTYTGSYAIANTTADEIVLVCGLSSTEIDRVNYTSSFAGDTGIAAQLDVDSYDHVENDTATNWCDATNDQGNGDLGTPGAENDPC